MFDLGFSEVLMVFVVALVVIGPKRMPGLVREVGRWVGKARSMARQFREQLETEVNLEDLANSDKKRTASASTPAPGAGLNGEPVSESTTQASTTATPDYGNYPYGESSVYETPASEAPAAEPKPGDDTYSHAHAHGAEPYFPPEHEGESWNSVPPLDAEPSQQELALNDMPLQPDPAAANPEPALAGDRERQA